MANKYQEDLKRIVGITDTAGGIAQQVEKKAIPGGRGIVYFDRNGDSQTASGTPGETTQPGGDNTTGGTDGGQADGSDSAGGSNGGNTTSLDGIDAPYPVDDATAENSGVFAVTDLRLGDQVNAITGLKDCTTGALVSIRFDGQFTAPAGWTDPDVGPADPEYVSGYYWGNSTDSVASIRGSTPDGCWALYKPYREAAVGMTIIEEGSRDTVVPGTRYKYWYKLSNNQWYTFTAWQWTCGGSQDSYCTVVPYPTSWPSSEPMQLSYNAETGKYETHQMDGNVTTEYTQPVSQISLCNSAGEPIQSYPTADGGQALYNSTTGVAVFIDSTGKVSGFGDAQAITNRLPR